MEIYTVADKNFWRTALNWSAHLNRLKIENYMIGCLDEESVDELDKRGARAELLPLSAQDLQCIEESTKKNDRSYKKPSVAKAVILSGLLKRKTDFIFSDSDAVWLKDPLPQVQAYWREGYDILFSINPNEGAYPIQSSKLWGFSLSGGWFAVQYDAKTDEFFSRLLEKWYNQPPYNPKAHGKYPDLQAIMNEEVRDLGVRLPESLVSQFQYRRRVDGKRNQDLSFQWDMGKAGLKLKFLKENFVARGGYSKGKTVYHGLAIGSDGEKQRILGGGHNNLWIIEE